MMKGCRTGMDTDGEFATIAYVDMIKTNVKSVLFIPDDREQPLETIGTMEDLMEPAPYWCTQKDSIFHLQC